MANYAGIFCALIFSGAINLCIFIAVWKIIHLSYVTNKRIVLNEEYNIFIYLYNIISYNITKCKFEVPATFSELFGNIISIFYNKHIIISKEEYNDNLNKSYSFTPKEMRYEIVKFCHCEIVEEMIYK